MTPVEILARRAIHATQAYCDPPPQQATARRVASWLMRAAVRGMRPRVSIQATEAALDDAMLKCWATTRKRTERRVDDATRPTDRRLMEIRARCLVRRWRKEAGQNAPPQAYDWARDAAWRTWKRHNPSSRRTGWVALVKSTSCVRVRDCAACGARHSESAKWGRTAHMDRFTERHKEGRCQDALMIAARLVVEGGEPMAVLVAFGGVPDDVVGSAWCINGSAGREHQTPFRLP